VQARIDEQTRLVAERPNAVFGIVRKQVGKGGDPRSGLTPGPAMVTLIASCDRALA
jgi:hypothetical protein